MPARSRSWSSRARRDFDEREDYRKRRDEEDRYKKKDDDETDDRGRKDERQDNETPERREEDARRDRREERGWFDDIEDRFRNGDESTDYDGLFKQLRERYDWYEEELDRYDADYDNLMAEVDRLRNDNRRYFMREGRRDDRPSEELIKKEQDKDIRDDGKEMSFDDLWKKAKKED